jgi:hypothetical protein
LFPVDKIINLPFQLLLNCYHINYLRELIKHIFFAGAIPRPNADARPGPSITASRRQSLPIITVYNLTQPNSNEQPRQMNQNRNSVRSDAPSNSSRLQLPVQITRSAFDIRPDAPRPQSHPQVSTSPKNQSKLRQTLLQAPTLPPRKMQQSYLVPIIGLEKYITESVASGLLANQHSVSK